MIGARIGLAATAHGWRKEAADRLTDPLARRLPLSAEQVRPLLGLLFVLSSAAYLARTARRATRGNA